jgi:hypothetical protein
MVTRYWLGRCAGAILVVAGAILIAPGSVASTQEGGPRFKAHPSTQEPARLVTLDTLKKWEKELSNWGRWGKDDQRGLLNLVTPEKTKAAMALVTEAKTVTLQMNPIKKTGMDTGGFGENLHRMARIHPVTGAVQGALDVITLSIHDGLSSHMDALCHYQGPIGRKPNEPAVSYNGFPFTLTAAGCIESAADRMGPGYIMRGVLVDLPLMKGVKWLEPSTDHPRRALGEACGRGAVGVRPGGSRAACVRVALVEGARCLPARERRGERRAAVWCRGHQPPDSPAHAGEHGPSAGG